MSNLATFVVTLNTHMTDLLMCIKSRKISVRSRNQKSWKYLKMVENIRNDKCVKMWRVFAIQLQFIARTKQQRTRLPSNLRPTTRECMHLVTRGHVRSRDKDGGHTIRSVISENPMIHAKPMGLSFIEPELRAIEVSHYGNSIFHFFARVTLTLIRWPSYTNLTRITVEIHRSANKVLAVSKCLNKCIQMRLYNAFKNA